MDPVWVDDTVYFISDRGNYLNIYRISNLGLKAGAGGEGSRIFDVRRLTLEPARCGFEQAGYVHGRLDHAVWQGTSLT